MNPVGIDFSHWDGLVDWDKTKAAGISFAFCKCTQGISFFDDQYTRNMRESGRVGILRGAYHYYITAMPPIAQARWFASHLEDCELLPVVDLEDKLSVPSDIITRVRTFLIELERQVNKQPIIYISFGYWNPRMLGAIDWADQYPLWAANYRSDSGPLVPLPWAPTNWTFWQFTKSAKAAKYGSRKASVDLNVFNGSMAELEAFCGIVERPAVTYSMPIETFTHAPRTNTYVVRN